MDEITISTMRLVFSSSVARITAAAARKPTLAIKATRNLGIAPGIARFTPNVARTASTVVPTPRAGWRSTRKAARQTGTATV